MLSRFIGFILLIGSVYLVCIFLIPEIADKYGNSDINAKIRSFKDNSLLMASGSTSASSIVDRLKTEAQKTLQEGTKTIEQIQTTVEQKTKQVQDTADSVKTAIDAVEKAKDDISTLTNLSGTTKQ